MIKDLLLKQLNHELMATVQMSYFAGVVKNPSLEKSFLEFAKDELEHFSKVASILSKMGYQKGIEPFEIRVETDELKALIVLESVEDTLIHYYEDMLPGLREPYKGLIKEIINEEVDHKERMRDLLEKAKKDKKSRD